MVINKNEWRVAIDVKKRDSKPSLVFVQQDINANQLNIQLFDNGKVLDISTANSATITILKSDSLVVQAAATIEDATNGKLSYILSAQALGALGNTRATIELYGDDSVRITSAIFNYVVIAALDDLGSSEIISEAEYAILTTLITEINNFNHKGEYVAETQYYEKNVVSYLGSSYMATQDTLGNLPTNVTYWQLTASKGDPSDMTKAVYDPTNVSSDAFDMGNMVESSTKKVLTDVERDKIGKYLSSGVVVEPSKTDLGTGSVTIGAGTYRFFPSTDFTGSIVQREITGDTFILTDGDINYVVAKYNSGIPTVEVTLDVNDINTSDVLPVLTIARDGNDLVILDWNTAANGLSNKLQDRLVKIHRFEIESGLSISASLLKLLSTTGVVWYGSKKITLDAVNTALAENDIYLFENTNGTWTKTVVDDIDNLQYNDPVTGFQTLTSNRYSVSWVFRTVDDSKKRFGIILGNGDYTLSQAQSSYMPVIPNKMAAMGVFVGRIIIKKGATSPYSVEQVQSVSLAYTQVSDHNNLTGLQGGQADQYYHLTSAEKTKVEQISVTQPVDLDDMETDIDSIKNASRSSIQTSQKPVDTFPTGTLDGKVLSVIGGQSIANSVANNGFTLDSNVDGLADNLTVGANITVYSWVSGAQTISLDYANASIDNHVAFDNAIFDDTEIDDTGEWFFVIDVKNNEIDAQQFTLNRGYYIFKTETIQPSERKYVLYKGTMPNAGGGGSRTKLVIGTIISSQKSFTIYNVHAINMTQYGLTSKTEAEMLDIVRQLDAGTDLQHSTLDVETVTKNLFDKTVRTLNKYIDKDDGTLKPSTIADVSDWIKVSAGSTIFINNSIGYCTFNNDKQYLNGVYSLGAVSIVENGYVRYAVNKTNVDSSQLENGSSFTFYKPFNNNLFQPQITLRSLPNLVRDYLKNATLDGGVYKPLKSWEHEQNVSTPEAVVGVVAINVTNYPLAKTGGTWINDITGGGVENGIIGTDSTSASGTLQYELATPVITPLTLDEIMSFSSGTIYQHQTVMSEIALNTSVNQGSQIEGNTDMIESLDDKVKHIEGGTATGSATVTFDTAFAIAPAVMPSDVTSITTTGFTMNGSGGDWIATEK